MMSHTLRFAATFVAMACLVGLPSPASSAKRDVVVTGKPCSEVCVPVPESGKRCIYRCTLLYHCQDPLRSQKRVCCGAISARCRGYPRKPVRGERSLYPIPTPGPPPMLGPRGPAGGGIMRAPTRR